MFRWGNAYKRCRQNSLKGRSLRMAEGAEAITITKQVLTILAAKES